jgi:hypothetical protein
MEEIKRYTQEETKKLIPLEEHNALQYLIRAAFRQLTATPDEVKREKHEHGYYPETRRWVTYYWAGYLMGVGCRESGNPQIDLFHGIAKHSEDRNRNIISEFSRGYVDGLNCLGEDGSSYFMPADGYFDEDIEKEIKSILIL